ncbi:hypothetical protein N825_27145 [Skermanella stibiiresistens SB22]|uniref:Toprim domain-containing protein n=1 Tax=Skermanella stibiiresistens SB22 TaxID=1385369 RepID=W9GRN1_9PROT|nr:hypothetical protein N825_27145 [Skermanella stibiiresistens SB22]
MLVVATDLAGNVHGLQAIRLDATSGKRVKLSAGSIASNKAVGWLSGGDGDVILTEGPEDAISIHAARRSGMVGAAFGGVKRLVGSVPPGRRVIIAAQNDPPESRAAKSLTEACDLLMAAGHDVWVARPPQGIKDANDLLRTGGVSAVRAMLDAAGPVVPPGGPKQTPPFPTETVVDPKPYWPSTDVDGVTAHAELQILIEDWMCAVERWLDARDHAADQRDAFLNDGMSEKERRKAKRDIKRSIARAFPGVDLERPPRLQVAAAAGLGKSSGLREAYLRHPRLWRRQFHGFLPTVKLARDFEDAMRDAMGVSPTAPLVVLHRGRDHEAELGNAPCARWKASRRLAGKVPSLFGAMCERGETKCPHFSACAYIDNYQTQGPGLHLFVHDHLTKAKPLNFPKADFAFVDEDATQALLTHSVVGAAILSDPSTYQTAALTNEQDDAASLGNRLLVAITSGAPMLAAIRKANITTKELKTLADWTQPTDQGPEISPAMSDEAIEAIAEKLTPHHGEIVGRIVRQIASELRHDRDIAHGVVYGDGNLHLHRHSRVRAAPKGIPLLIIDADADLGVNRVLFGDNLTGHAIKAKRLGRVVQVRNATLAKSYIAPETAFSAPTDRQVEHAKALRARILAWIASKAKGKRVLVVTNKPVRVAFTGEPTGRIPVSIDFQGATWSHYGAVLGVDAWRDHDVVILIGREQMSAVAGERQARAIHCDDPEPLNLTGGYRKAMRCHRMRDGSSVPVEVHEHEDARVQARVEAKRERGMAQAIDRLRLIHGRPDREILILSNLPLPGVTVDRMMTLDELLEGGTTLERLVDHARREWGVLPLVPDFLVQHAPGIVSSRRTAERLVAEFKTANPLIECYLPVGGFKLGRFWTMGQRRPSSVILFGDTPTAAGIAALERLVGNVTIQIPADEVERSPNVDRPVQEDPIVVEPAAVEMDFERLLAAYGREAIINRWPIVEQEGAEIRDRRPMIWKVSSKVSSKLTYVGRIGVPR